MMKFDMHLPIYPEKSVLKLDGKELKRVTGLKITAGADEIPTVTLKFVPDEINITGEGFVLRDAGLSSYSDEELLKLVAERIGSKIKIDFGNKKGEE